MPRRSILSVTERESLLAIPAAGDELIRLYTFSDADLALIRQHRGAQNRLGFADSPRAPCRIASDLRLTHVLDTWSLSRCSMCLHQSKSTLRLVNRSASFGLEYPLIDIYISVLIL
jgi:Domain of unknown function (DUF4158)